LEEHWLAAVTIWNTHEWLWQPQEHPGLAYSDYLKALRLAERHLQQTLVGLA
jgi:hypothetical protein